MSPQEVAGHLGHTLIELSRTYARELAEYRGRHLDIGAEIARVRGHDIEASEAPPPRPVARRSSPPGPCS